MTASTWFRLLLVRNAREPLPRLAFGKRYRLKLRNATDDIHPVHLHRHSFELTSLASAPAAGVIKDVAMIGGFRK